MLLSDAEPRWHLTAARRAVVAVLTDVSHGSAPPAGHQVTHPHAPSTAGHPAHVQPPVSPRSAATAHRSPARPHLIRRRGVADGSATTGYAPARRHRLRQPTQQTTRCRPANSARSRTRRIPPKMPGRSVRHQYRSRTSLPPTFHAGPGGPLLNRLVHRAHGQSG
jgi:hypothetical protein